MIVIFILLKVLLYLNLKIEQYSNGIITRLFVFAYVCVCAHNYLYIYCTKWPQVKCTIKYVKNSLQVYS